MPIIETLARQAAHKRDHGLHTDRSAEYNCSTCFEIIFVGRSCFCICHDCGFDTPLLSESQAEIIRSRHYCPQC